VGTLCAGAVLKDTPQVAEALKKMLAINPPFRQVKPSDLGATRRLGLYYAKGTRNKLLEWNLNFKLLKVYVYTLIVVPLSCVAKGCFPTRRVFCQENEGVPPEHHTG
jgi:hypothetical protein